MTLGPAEVLRGTLDMLALRALMAGPNHGWGLAQQIRMLSRDVLVVNQGSLYPALQRLKRRGWVTAFWRTSEHNRRARYYRLTAAGRRQLAREVAQWRESATAVNRVLALAWSPK